MVSKVDQCRARLLERTVKQLEKVLKSPGCKKVPFRVETEDDALTAAATFHSDRYDKGSILSTSSFLHVHMHLSFIYIITRNIYRATPVQANIENFFN